MKATALENLVAKALTESLSAAAGADALNETLSSLFVYRGGDATDSPVVDTAETLIEAGIYTTEEGLLLAITDDKGARRELRISVKEWNF